MAIRYYTDVIQTSVVVISIVFGFDISHCCKKNLSEPLYDVLAYRKGVTEAIR